MKKLITNKLFLFLTFLFSVIFLFSCGSKKNSETEPTADSLATEAFKKQMPEWAKNANIYEVNIRQYTQEGTFKAFQEHLPRLKAMGVDILWIMPIHPIGMKNRKGTLGSYYAVQNYKEVNPEFGTLEDFKALVNKAHELGFKVIIDWVANHTSWDNVWITANPEWYTQNDKGEIIAPVEDWADVADLNYDNADMQNAMIDALKYWVTETGIDGYRCDVAGMVPNEFWVKARKELDAIKPVFMLAEWGEPQIHEAFDMSYGWDMHHIMNDVAQGKASPLAFDTLFTKIAETYPQEAFMMQFTSNHDENSWNGTEYERMGDAVKAFAVFAATIPGMPLIYSGQEAGFNKRLDFFEKDLIVWKDNNMTGVYTKLLTLKKENAALWHGEAGGSFTKIVTDADNKVYAFVREKDDKKVVVIINMSKSQVNVNFTTEAAFGKYKSLLDDKEMTLESGKPLKLKAWEAYVLVK